MALEFNRPSQESKQENPINPRLIEAYTNFISATNGKQDLLDSMKNGGSEGIAYAESLLNAQKAVMKEDYGISNPTPEEVLEDTIFFINNAAIILGDYKEPS